MKKLFLILFITTPSVFSLLYAQEVRSGIANQSNLSNLGSGKPVFQTFDDRYDGVKGNRFFYDEFYHDGEVWLTDSTHLTNEAKYRFDQVSGSLQIKYPNGKEMYLNTLTINTFSLNIEKQNITFIKTAVPDKPREYALYQIIYYSPTLKLLRDSRKKLSRVNDTGAYSRGEVYDEIENDYHYYMQKANNKMVEVKLSRKSFTKALPEMERKIEAIFNSPKYKGDLTISKLAEIMQKLDER